MVCVSSTSLRLWSQTNNNVFSRQQSVSGDSFAGVAGPGLVGPRETASHDLRGLDLIDHLIARQEPASSADWRGALPEEVVAPADGRAVGPLRTRVKTPGADRREGAGRDHGLAHVVEAPAGGGAVALDGAGVVEARADGYDGGGRRGACPYALEPQQPTVPVTLMAHAWRPPTLIAVTVTSPAGKVFTP
jgi:hypothetical protein